MSMRIAWASPWNERSAIATFSVGVVEELLSRGHAVEVLRTEVGDAATLPPRQVGARVRFWSDVSVRELRHDADVVIVNFGDHYGFHGAMLDNFSDLGVVGIFHDLLLSHLAEGWAHASPEADATLRRIVQATYGSIEWNEDEPFRMELGAMARDRPMVEWFASGVAGAVVHAHHYADRVRAVCPGPVAVIPLAFEYPDLPSPRPMGAAQLVIATIGMLNANKRIDQVVTAIASSPVLRERCRYRLIGEIAAEEQTRLCQLSESLGVAPLEFTGWISDEELRTQLLDVDVVACLRYPSLEGGSASLVLSMQSARPTLVSSHATYAEVPDGMVLQCTAGEEATDVARHLQWVLENPSAARDVGERARAYSRQTHTARGYVDALLPLCETSIANQPSMLTGQALGKTLASFGLNPSDPAVQRISAAAGELFGERS